MFWAAKHLEELSEKWREKRNKTLERMFSPKKIATIIQDTFKFVLKLWPIGTVRSPSLQLKLDVFVKNACLPPRVPPCALLKEGKERDMTVLKRKRLLR